MALSRQQLLPLVLLLLASVPIPAEGRGRRKDGPSTRSSFEYWLASDEVDEVVYGTPEYEERIEKRRPGDAPLVVRNAMSDKTMRKLTRFKSVREIKSLLPRRRDGSAGFRGVKSNKMPTYSFWDGGMSWLGTMGMDKAPRKSTWHRWSMEDVSYAEMAPKIKEDGPGGAPFRYWVEQIPNDRLNENPFPKICQRFAPPSQQKSCRAPVDELSLWGTSKGTKANAHFDREQNINMQVDLVAARRCPQTSGAERAKQAMVHSVRADLWRQELDLLAPVTTAGLVYAPVCAPRKQTKAGAAAHVHISKGSAYAHCQHASR
jgi:hypothetical protein